MSNQIHSQDSASDPRNEDDYDTWEYGTEPVPGDHTWKKQSESDFEKVWREMDEIEPLTPITPKEEQDAFTQEALASYREAAKSDSYMFGDYDGYQAYKDRGDVPE